MYYYLVQDFQCMATNILSTSGDALITSCRYLLFTYNSDDVKFRSCTYWSINDICNHCFVYWLINDICNHCFVYWLINDICNHCLVCWVSNHNINDKNLVLTSHVKIGL